MQIEDEVASNRASFLALLPRLLISHKGKFVLLRRQNIVEYFDTGRDAYFAGRLLYAADQLFSVEEIVERPPRLGPAIDRYVAIHP